MQARLRIDELQQLKWLIGGLLILLSLWSLNGLDLIGFGLHFILMLGTAGALFKPAWVHAIPEVVWSRFLVPLILIWVLIDFGLGFTSLIAPLMRMVMLLLLYRMLAPRKRRREDLQMVLLCLFSILVSGAITVSLLFALQILLFTPIAMAFLLVVCLLDKGSESADDLPNWEQFSLIRLIRRVWRAANMRAVLLGGLLFAIVVGLSTGLFILIPRFDFGQTVPFMQMETTPRSGFSDTVSLNSVSEITKDRSIALRIDGPSVESIRSLPYWRILVLDLYKKGEFSLSGNMANSRSRMRLKELSEWTQQSLPAELPKGMPWTFYFEGGVSRYLPLPTLFQTIRFTKEQTVQLLPDLRVIGLDSVQKSTFSYQIEKPYWDVRMLASSRERKAFNCYSRGCDHVADQMSGYPYTNVDLTLEESDRSVLSELNTKIIGRTDESSLSTAQYGERVVSYLRNKFRYSLNPDGIEGGAGDPIVNWLKKGSIGHCELYAGAFVLLAREAGYPARMVVGFVGGSWNPVENFFVVRNSDAHAWAEIYDFETQEWLRVDPTPGNGSTVDSEILERVSFEVETGMLAWVDSLRIQWYRRIISFDQDDQIKLATSLADAGDSLFKKLSTKFKGWITSLKELVTQPFSRENLLRLAMILGICCGVFILWRSFFSWSHLIFHFWKKSETLSPVRRQASRYIAKVRTRIDDLSTGHIDTQELQEVYAQLEALRFGPEVSPQTARTVFKRTRKALLHS